VSFVQEWRLQVTRALGVSIIAPVMLLAAAAVVAAGGLSGVGSIGQIASGPELPQTAVGGPSESDLARGEIVGADVAAAEALAGATGSAPAGGAAAGGGVQPVGPTTPGGPVAPAVPETGVAPTPSEPAPPGGGSTGGGNGGGAAPGQPSGPLDPVVETGREIAGSVPGPLGPVTNDLLDTLLGPPPAP
jgi:hypothetical protein